LKAPQINVTWVLTSFNPTIEFVVIYISSSALVVCGRVIYHHSTMPNLLSSLDTFQMVLCDFLFISAKDMLKLNLLGSDYTSVFLRQCQGEAWFLWTKIYFALPPTSHKIILSGMSFILIKWRNTSAKLMTWQKIMRRERRWVLSRWNLVHGFWSYDILG